jgi:hypothetical protein
MKKITDIDRIVEMSHNVSKESKRKIIVDQWNHSLIEVKNEYPVVKYEKAWIQPELPPRLNSLIRNITVSVITLGQIYTVSTDSKLETKEVEDKTLVYFENTHGDLIVVNGNSVHDFLLRKPNLCVTPNGILLFYDEREVIATFDLDNYTYVTNYLISLKNDEHVESVTPMGNNKRGVPYAKICVRKVISQKLAENRIAYTFDASKPTRTFLATFSHDFSQDIPLSIKVNELT